MLIHYTNEKSYNSIISNKEIWLSSPRKSKDIYEFGIISGSMYTYDPEINELQTMEIFRCVAGIIYNSFYISTTINNARNGRITDARRNENNWQNFGGVDGRCIGFNRETIIEKITTTATKFKYNVHLGEMNYKNRDDLTGVNVNQFFKKYVRNSPLLSVSTEIRDWVDTLSDEQKTCLYDAAKAIMLEKSDVFVEESEFRIFAYPQMPMNSLPPEKLIVDISEEMISVNECNFYYGYVRTEHVNRVRDIEIHAT
jgi:hypothetical protein